MSSDALKKRKSKVLRSEGGTPEMKRGRELDQQVGHLEQKEWVVIWKHFKRILLLDEQLLMQSLNFWTWVTHHFDHKSESLLV